MENPRRVVFKNLMNFNRRQTCTKGGGPGKARVGHEKTKKSPRQIGGIHIEAYLLTRWDNIRGLWSNRGSESL